MHTSRTIVAVDGISGPLWVRFISRYRTNTDYGVMRNGIEIRAWVDDSGERGLRYDPDALDLAMTPAQVIEAVDLYRAAERAEYEAWARKNGYEILPA